MKLHIKYMVSTRCKMLVKAELDKMELDYAYVELGEVQLKKPLTPRAICATAIFFDESGPGTNKK